MSNADTLVNKIDSISEKVERVMEQMYGYYDEADPSEVYFAETGSSMQDEEEWDMVNNPQHYHKNGMEVIDIIEAFTPDSYSYCMGNAIKYLLRHQDKGKPVQDLEKCIWYINRMKNDWRNQ
jgi:hypothetical protein